MSGQDKNSNLSDEMKQTSNASSKRPVEALSLQDLNSSGEKTKRHRRSNSMAGAKDIVLGERGNNPSETSSDVAGKERASGPVDLTTGTLRARRASFDSSTLLNALQHTPHHVTFDNSLPARTHPKSKLSRPLSPHPRPQPSPVPSSNKEKPDQDAIMAAPSGSGSGNVGRSQDNISNLELTGPSNPVEDKDFQQRTGESLSARMKRLGIDKNHYANRIGHPLPLGSNPMSGPQAAYAASLTNRNAAAAAATTTPATTAATAATAAKDATKASENAEGAPKGSPLKRAMEILRHGKGKEAGKE